MENSVKAAIAKAIEITGSQQELARRCHVSQSQVSYLLNKAKSVPNGWARKIEAATEGQVTRQELLPELFE